jgi:hypothetical protein
MEREGWREIEGILIGLIDLLQLSRCNLKMQTIINLELRNNFQK